LVKIFSIKIDPIDINKFGNNKKKQLADMIKA